MKNIPRRSVVEVLWVDSSSLSAWAPLREHLSRAATEDGVIHRSVGYLLNVSKTAVSLCQSWSDEDEADQVLADVITIPLVAVTGFKVLSRRGR